MASNCLGLYYKKYTGLDEGVYDINDTSAYLLTSWCSLMSYNQFLMKKTKYVCKGQKHDHEF